MVPLLSSCKLIVRVWHIVEANLLHTNCIILHLLVWFYNHYLSESDWPHHDMSLNVTMLNWKTFHDIWWHLDCSAQSGSDFYDVLNIAFLSGLPTDYDISWQIMKWLHLIQRGRPLPKTDPDSYSSRKVVTLSHSGMLSHQLLSIKSRSTTSARLSTYYKPPDYRQTKSMDW